MATIKLEIEGNRLVPTKISNGSQACNPFNKAFVIPRYSSTNRIFITQSGEESNFVEGIFSDFADENGVEFVSLQALKTWLNTNTGFNPALGGSKASDFDPTTIIDETFSDTYDQSRITVTNATVDTSGGTFRVICNQTPTTGVLLNGTYNASISKLRFNPIVYGKSALIDVDIALEVKIITTPDVNRRYFGAGIDASGFKTPQDGGWLASVSSTLSDNATFSQAMESARIAMGQLIPVNSIVKIIAEIRGSNTTFKIYLNGTLIKVNQYQGIIANDLLARSVGEFCIYGSGLTFELLSYKATDVSPSVADVVVIGDSNTQGHGLQSSTNQMSYANVCAGRSGLVWHIYGRSSMCMQDAVDVLNEVVRPLKDSGTVIIDLSTNDVILNRTVPQIQGYTEAFVSAIHALKPSAKIVILTTPPIAPAGAVNTLSNSVAVGMLTWFTGVSYVKVVDVRSVLVQPATIVWDDMKKADNNHLNIYGNQVKFEKIKLDCPEVF
jgi:lysophospholipase L1-like esterase